MSTSRFAAFSQILCGQKRAIGGALSSHLAKYVAKPGVGLDAWPSRMRWAQTIIAKVPRQVPRGTPEPRGWLVDRFPRFATERAVRECFDLEIARRERELRDACGQTPLGEVWSHENDGARAPPAAARCASASEYFQSNAQEPKRSPSPLARCPVARRLMHPTTVSRTAQCPLFGCP
jgi:hypothetical protein